VKNPIKIHKHIYRAIIIIITIIIIIIIATSPNMAWPRWREEAAQKI
jgi:hypothetical protein